MDNARYIDREYIGSGGMASVYKAFDRTLERHVAIKEMAQHMRQNADVRKLFVDEARKMAAVRDRNVVQVYDVFDQDGVPTIVMELMEGGSISSRLGPGALPVDEVLDIITQVASGLRAIHRVGVVHRDVKPENIIEDRGVCKITDFGVAMSGDEDTLPFVTSKYAAPEVLLQPDKIDKSSDLYSLGMMAAELLLGTRRFEETVRDLIQAEQSVELPAIHDSAQAFWQQWVASPTELPMLNTIEDTIPVEVASLIGRLIRRDKEARIQDCDALLAELGDLRRRVHQSAGAATMHDPKLARKLKKLKQERQHAAAKPDAVKPKSQPKPVRKKRSLGLRLVGGILAVLLLGVLALLFWPAGFRVDIVTDPAGAIVTHNGLRYDDYPTPTWFTSAWGDSFMVEVEGRPPVEVVLAEGMAGLTSTDEGFVLDLSFAAPDVIDTSEKAAALIRAWLEMSPAPEIGLAGASPGTDGTYSVPLGTDLDFSISSASGGALTVVHLGADDAVTLIYPDPVGAGVVLNADDTVSVGPEIGLVTSEPTGREWFVFLVNDTARTPPEINGMQPIDDWARRYPFGDGASPGQRFVYWLLGTSRGAEFSGSVVPLEIVP